MADQSIAQKTCTKCGETKVLTEYYKHPKGKWGRAPNCRRCHAAAMKKWKRLHRRPNKKRTPEHNAWLNARERCSCLSIPSYGNYGGRGISMCFGWRHSRKSFLEDMGPRPSPQHSLDRIANEGGYWCGHCPECVAAGRPMNCRWATLTQQCRNTRRTTYLTYEGKTLPMQDWVDLTGIPPSTLWNRVVRGGWSVERALTEPPQRRR